MTIAEANEPLSNGLKIIIEGQGWCSCYICLPCIENWLEESGQVKDGGVE